MKKPREADWEATSKDPFAGQNLEEKSRQRASNDGLTATSHLTIPWKEDAYCNNNGDKSWTTHIKQISLSHSTKLALGSTTKKKQTIAENTEMNIIMTSLSLQEESLWCTLAQCKWSGRWVAWPTRKLKKNVQSASPEKNYDLPPATSCSNDPWECLFSGWFKFWAARRIRLWAAKVDAPGDGLWEKHNNLALWEKHNNLAMARTLGGLEWKTSHGLKYALQMNTK
jgi:hypothetical protein